MNVIDLFKREIVRPLVTLAIPGAVAILPYVYLLFYSPGFRAFWANNNTWINFLLIISFIAVGLILEDIGSQLEIGIRKLFNDNSGDTWEKYIRLESKAESIAQTYISTIVLRMKFELGMATGLICAIPGIWKICASNCMENRQWIIGFLAFLIVYLIVEVIFSVNLLHETRKSIVAQETVPSSHKEIEGLTLTGSLGHTPQLNNVNITGRLNFKQSSTGTVDETETESRTENSNLMQRWIDSIQQWIDSNTQLGDSNTQLKNSIQQLRDSITQLGDSNTQLGDSNTQLENSIQQLRDSIQHSIKSIEQKNQLKRAGSSLVNFITILIFYVLFFIISISILNTWKLSYVCINNPSNSAQFVNGPVIDFAGKTSNDIDNISAYVTPLNSEQDNILLKQSIPVTNNVWSFKYQFNQSGNRKVVVKGLKEDKIVTEKTVKIRILD